MNLKILFLSTGLNPSTDLLDPAQCWSLPGMQRSTKTKALKNYTRLSLLPGHNRGSSAGPEPGMVLFWQHQPWAHLTLLCPCTYWHTSCQMAVKEPLSNGLSLSLFWNNTNLHEYLTLTQVLLTVTQNSRVEDTVAQLWETVSMSVSCCFYGRTTMMRYTSIIHESLNGDLRDKIIRDLIQCLHQPWTDSSLDIMNSPLNWS